MDVRFTKMEGCGNDYVYISGFDFRLDPEKKPEIVQKLSDRHFGIGGDGVIFINPSEIADFEMEMWNADGTRGEMCGNGIRCVGKFVYDSGMTDKKEITVESFGKVILVDQRAAAVVDKDHAVFHLTDVLFIDDPLCFREERAVKEYDI
jgi:diaminopimelate epimerase